MQLGGRHRRFDGLTKEQVIMDICRSDGRGAEMPNDAIQKALKRRTGDEAHPTTVYNAKKRLKEEDVEAARRRPTSNAAPPQDDAANVSLSHLREINRVATEVGGLERLIQLAGLLQEFRK